MSDTSPPCVQTSQKISDTSTTGETDFCETDHFSMSFQTLDIMRRNNILCDIQFNIGDKKVFAHKNILSCFSDYFQKMFYGNFGDFQILEINNVEITANSFELIIDFIYTSLLRINNSNVQELLRASSFLSLENVKEVCQTFIKQTVCIENFIDITDMAVSYKLDNLYDFCLSYALQNYNDFVKSNVFLSLSYELLIKLIQSDDLCAVEEMVFESAMLWLKHDIVGRSKHSLDLLKAVRLCLMENEYLNNTVCQENLIKSNAQCMEYLLDIIKIKKGKDVHEMSSIFNVYHRINNQVI